MSDEPMNNVHRLRPGAPIDVAEEATSPVVASHIVILPLKRVTIGVQTNIDRTVAKRWRAMGLTVLEVMNESPRHWSVRWLYQLREWMNRRHA